MLLLRLQDPLGEGTSGGLFGEKVFAFCDNLDTVNRLFSSLLSAEGRRPNAAVDAQNRPLALLRSETHHPAEDWNTRDAEGQNWWMVDRLRESPVPPEIDLVSAQSPGVKDNAVHVVATSSLEVGYDDPGVGAVLQHKAPRDVAGFLQRRGRAGRPQIMRPWTVVVLSDYGRDRLTYQRYEELLDPELPPKALPLAKIDPRMQASFAVVDWLGHRLADFDRGNKGHVFRDLGPLRQWNENNCAAKWSRSASKEVIDDHELRGAEELANG